MKRFRSVALAVVVALGVACVGYAVFSRLVSPQSVARADSYRVWIALLKGFEGDVYYVGSDTSNTYFRIGRMFWSYYKVPACAAQAPHTFPVGSGQPYVVRLHVQPDNSINIGKTCSGEQGYGLGKLDRAQSH